MAWVAVEVVLIQASIEREALPVARPAPVV